MKKIRDSEDGSALIVVMCVMVIFTALSLAILLSASVLFNDTQDIYADKKLEMAAESFKTVFEKQLTAGTTIENEETSNDKSNIHNYLISELGTIIRNPKDTNPYYWQSGKVRYFNAEYESDSDSNIQVEEEAGTILVQMQWSYSEADPKAIERYEGKPTSEETIPDGLKEEIEKLKNRGVVLEITFTAQRKSTDATNKSEKKVEVKGTYDLQIEGEVSNVTTDGEKQWGLAWSWTSGM